MIQRTGLEIESGSSGSINMDQIRCAPFSHEKIPGTLPYLLSAVIKSTMLLREVEGGTGKVGKRNSITRNLSSTT